MALTTDSSYSAVLGAEVADRFVFVTQSPLLLIYIII